MSIEPDGAVLARAGLKRKAFQNRHQQFEEWTLGAIGDMARRANAESWVTPWTTGNCAAPDSLIGNGFPRL